jgi:hypothetical protein
MRGFHTPSARTLRANGFARQRLTDPSLQEDPVLCINCDAVVPDDSLLCSACESDVKQALVHEAGHALMAVRQGMMCLGICFDREEGKFCAVGPPPKPIKELSKQDYLFSAAGVAAEKVIYGQDHNSVGAERDRQDFGSSNAFEQAVSEACEILSGEEMRLNGLTSTLMAKIKTLSFNFSSLPTTEANGKLLSVLLRSEEVEAAVHQL